MGAPKKPMIDSNKSPRKKATPTPPPEPPEPIPPHPNPRRIRLLKARPRSEGNRSIGLTAADCACLADLLSDLPSGCMLITEDGFLVAVLPEDYLALWANDPSASAPQQFWHRVNALP